MEVEEKLSVKKENLKDKPKVAKDKKIIYKNNKEFEDEKDKISSN